MSKLHLAILGQEFDVTVSPSFLSEANCPFAMRAHRIDHFETPPNWNLEVGRAVHGVFEGIMRLQLRGAPVDEAAVDELFKACVGPLAIPHMPEIVRMVKLYLHSFHVPPAHVAGVEEEICLNDKGERVAWDDAYVGGYLDLIQIKGDAARIIDYKTQWNVLSRDDLDKHFQLTFYCVLLRKLYPHLKNFEVGIYYARHGFLMVSARTPQQLNACEHEIELRIAQLQKIETWDPIAGEHCTVCDAISICPLATDLSDVPLAIVTRQQAEHAAGRLRVLDLVKKKLTDGLKQYAGENGSIDVGGTYAYGFVPRPSYEYPREALEKKLIAHAYPIESVLSVNKTALKKLLKRIRRDDEGAYDDIMTVTTREVKTSFKGFKPGSDDDDDEEEGG